MLKEKKKEGLKKLKEAEAVINKTSQQIGMLLTKQEVKLSQLKEKRISERKSGAEENERLQNLVYHYNLALGYDRADRFGEAVREYKKALEIDFNDADTHYNLAIIYDDYLNDKEKAIKHYQRYLELRPGAEDVEKVNSWIIWAKQSLEFGR